MNLFIILDRLKSSVRFSKFHFIALDRNKLFINQIIAVFVHNALPTFLAAFVYRYRKKLNRTSRL